MKSLIFFLLLLLLTTASLSFATQTESFQTQVESTKPKAQNQNNNNKGGGGGGNEVGTNGFTVPGIGFTIPIPGNWWGNIVGLINPTVVCKDEGPCYQKKLTCPAKCFTSFTRSGNGFGGGGGCSFDCNAKCVASC